MSWCQENESIVSSLERVVVLLIIDPGNVSIFLLGLSRQSPCRLVCRLNHTWPK